MIHANLWLIVSWTMNKLPVEWHGFACGAALLRTVSLPNCFTCNFACFNNTNYGIEFCFFVFFDYLTNNIEMIKYWIKLFLKTMQNMIWNNLENKNINRLSGVEYFMFIFNFYYYKLLICAERFLLILFKKHAFVTFRRIKKNDEC